MLIISLLFVLEYIHEILTAHHQDALFKGWVSLQGPDKALRVNFLTMILPPENGCLILVKSEAELIIGFTIHLKEEMDTFNLMAGDFIHNARANLILMLDLNCPSAPPTMAKEVTIYF